MNTLENSRPSGLEVNPCAWRPRNYADVKALSKSTKINVPDLLAMSCLNDPVYIMPAQAVTGKWFADLWDRFNLPNGVHLRRIHYKLVSQADPVLMPNGKPYENTDPCWQFLGAASKAARCLEMVPATSFIDARNPDAVLFRDYGEQVPTTLNMAEVCWDLPEIKADLAEDLDGWEFPTMELSGLEPDDYDHPFHLELITEKSTMDDVLVPLCEEMRVNYAPMSGFASITGIIGLLHRVKASGKPGAVLYVSDFDPAGSHMPVAVSRQIEFWRPVYCPGIDVVLNPVILTLEQVNRYNLPPIPIKETDKRQNNFKERYGVEGATELDALEALHPGELAKIFRKAVRPYLDSDCHNRVILERRRFRREVNEDWNESSIFQSYSLDRLKDQIASVVGRFKDDLEVLRQEMEDELRPLKDERDSLLQEIKNSFDVFAEAYTIPDRPVSPLGLPDEFNGLFDSRRDYLDQIGFYKTSGTDGGS